MASDYGLYKEGEGWGGSVTTNNSNNIKYDSLPR